jgi:hypothetical protein
VPGHLDFYAVVLFLHVTSAVIAFGAWFAFPIVDLTIRRVDLRSLPTWNEAQNQIAFKLMTPFATLLLITGIYMVSTDRWDGAGEAWFKASALIIVVLLGLSHGLLAPTARKLRDRAREDLAAGAAERGRMSDEYARLATRQRVVSALSMLLVLTALLLMVWKPGV